MRSILFLAFVASAAAAACGTLSAPASCTAGQTFAADLKCCSVNCTTFSGTCPAGQSVNNNKDCPANGCTVASCCFAPSCSFINSTYGGFQCSTSVIADPAKSNTACPAGGCDDTTCCMPKPPCIAQAIDFFMGPKACASPQIYSPVDYSTLGTTGNVAYKTCANSSNCQQSECCGPLTCIVSSSTTYQPYACTNANQGISLANVASTTLSDTGCGCSYNCGSQSAADLCDSVGLGLSNSFSASLASFTCTSTGCVDPGTPGCCTAASTSASGTTGAGTTGATSAGTTGGTTGAGTTGSASTAASTTTAATTAATSATATAGGTTGAAGTTTGTTSSALRVAPAVVLLVAALLA